LNVIDSPELHDLLLFLSVKLTDNDIPSCKKLGRLVVQKFTEEYNKMKQDIQQALGQVALTTDSWSDKRLQSYLAITAHYMAKDRVGRLLLQSHLIAFHRLTGGHAGLNIARIVMDVL
ncbi:hypothetical protein NEOLEDRAFT_1054476, partial [Neolentinus lepideus HHB14362 ss-1]